MTDRIYPNLATFFEESGVTQEELAERLDISQAYMSRIKNNLLQPPLPLALEISRLANVPLESLIREGRS